MKLADITPVHKKDDKNDKSKYRPISGLPLGSKIFEKIIHKQIGKCIGTFVSKYLCVYRKGYSVQHALIALLEKLRIQLEAFGILTMAYVLLNYMPMGSVKVL